MKLLNTLATLLLAMIVVVLSPATFADEKKRPGWRPCSS